MCAKKKTAPNRTWKLAGEALRSTPLRVEERERIAREFSDYEGFIRQKLALGESCVTFSELKTIEGAAMAVSAYLCDHFTGCYERGAVIAAVSTTAAIPAKLSERIGKLPAFLTGAALWLLDYVEEVCEAPEDYLSLLPEETDIIMDYSMPFADDLSHSRETILRMLTVLNGREGEYRKTSGAF